jgi:hypothetical protein
MQCLNLVKDLKVKVITYKRKDSLRNDFILIIISLAILLSYINNLRRGIMNVSIVNN